MTDISKQLVTGISKGIKLIAFVFFFFGCGFGLLSTPAGPLYPLFIVASLTDQSISPENLKYGLFSAALAGIIGLITFIWKGYSGWIGLLAGAIVGPFWIFWLALSLIRIKPKQPVPDTFRNN